MSAVMRIQFWRPGSKRWLTAAPKTRWRWVGEGTIRFEGSETVIQGWRARSFLPSAKQEVRFPSASVLNVVRTGSAVSGEVPQLYVTAEPVMFWANDEASASAIVAQWSKERTPAFAKALADQEAFNASLGKVAAPVVVTPALVAVNVLVYVLLMFRGVNGLAPRGPELIPWGSNYGVLTLNGEWWRLLTSMYLHFGLIHILLNMVALSSMGPLVEKLLGSARFALVYVFAGLCGSVASLLWNPAVNSAGASGAVFGVLGALLAVMVNPKTKIPATVSAAQRNAALIFIAYNLFNGLSHRGIDNACHVGGLVGGFAMGWMLARPLDPEARRDEWQGLLSGFAAGLGALALLSWPLTHVSAGVLETRQFKVKLNRFQAMEYDALALTGSLERLRSTKAISDEDWARRMLGEVVPLWEGAGDLIYDAPVAHGSSAEPVKEALLDYLNSRRLGAELRAEAIRDHDSAKQAWADSVNDHVEVQRQAASKLVVRLD